MVSIKNRYIFLLFLLASAVTVSAFLFVDNKVTGSALYQPSDIAGFIRDFAKTKVLERRENIQDRAAEVISDALKGAIDRAGRDALGEGNTQTSPGVKRVYRRDSDSNSGSNPGSNNVVYVERDDNKEMACRIVCEEA